MKNSLTKSKLRMFLDCQWQKPIIEKKYKATSDVGRLILVEYVQFMNGLSPLMSIFFSSLSPLNIDKNLSIRTHWLIHRPLRKRTQSIKSGTPVIPFFVATFLFRTIFPTAWMRIHSGEHVTWRPRDGHRRQLRRHFSPAASSLGRQFPFALHSLSSPLPGWSAADPKVTQRNGSSNRLLKAYRITLIDLYYYQDMDVLI